MKSIRLFLYMGGLCCSLAASSTLAADNELAQSHRFLRHAPSDIVALARRVIGCRRLSAVKVTDEASDAGVEAAFRTLRCDTLAADAQALRRRYAGSESALKAIGAAYDPGQ
jgi:hypothetical protein